MIIISSKYSPSEAPSWFHEDELYSTLSTFTSGNDESVKETHIQGRQQWSRSSPIIHSWFTRLSFDWQWGTISATDAKSTIHPLIQRHVSSWRWKIMGRINTTNITNYSNGNFNLRFSWNVKWVIMEYWLISFLYVPKYSLQMNLVLWYQASSSQG